MPIPIPPPTPPGLYVTSQDIISGSLRLINVLASGESLGAAEGQDALVILNQMMDSWQADGNKIYAESRQVFGLTSGKQVYTIGIDPSGSVIADFNVPRPSRIDRMSILQINSTPQPIELPLEYITYDQWATIPVKNVSSALPQMVWDDGAFPLRNLSFWPIPNTVTDTVIYSWGILGNFADLGSTRYSFPPGYLLAIRYSLAEFLAPEYGAQSLPSLAIISAKAQELKNIIHIQNAPVIDLLCDPALVDSDKGAYNFYSDTPVRK